MAELKTQPTEASVEDFMNAQPEPRRAECEELLKIFEEITGEKPVMWGKVIIGFGQYRYKYATGREGDWMKVGFSPKKANLTIYLMDGVENHAENLAKLGNSSCGSSCLYITKLAGVDMNVLREMIQQSYNFPR
ncbi:MAG: DUF1801 domain-containing protein [Fimbriimonadaceae bacterium]